jgi:hypothetical protein
MCCARTGVTKWHRMANVHVNSIVACVAPVVSCAPRVVDWGGPPAPGTLIDLLPFIANFSLRAQGEWAGKRGSADLRPGRRLSGLVVRC